ncbi:MAG: V-type ATP synthase subunit D [Spirochaetes bacterium]|nr:V-type ATP synthase subunit D [Spirochaetota bacterium]
MPGIDVPPTKTSLRRIKSELAFAREGFDLLQQKREILVMEIMKHAREVGPLESGLRETLADYYRLFGVTAMEMGSDVIAMKGHSERESLALELSFTRLMGIALPIMEGRPLEIRPRSGFAGTTAGYDECKRRCRETLLLLARYATVLKTIFVLSRELKKVQRKVNALEKVFIPRNEEAKKFISDRLEEMEREEIFVKKLINLRSR